MPLEESKTPSLGLAAVSLIVSIGGGFNFGFQLLVTNPAQEAFVAFLNRTHREGNTTRESLLNEWGFIVSSLFWGMALGALAIRKVVDDVGRKFGLITTFFLQAVTMTMSVLSFFMVSDILYIVSRFLLGFFIAISIGIGPVFVMECSSIHCRGVISLSTAFVLHFALVLGAIVGMPEVWGTTDSWWKIYAFELCLTLAATVLTIFVHDSPEYLISKKKFREAKKSLMFYRSLNDEEAIIELVKIYRAGNGDETDGLLGALKNKSSRNGTLMGSFVMGISTLSGIAAINAYAYDMMISIGLQPFHASIANVITNVVQVISVFRTAWIVDRYGRRPILIVCYAILAVVNVCIAAFMYLHGFTQSQLLGWCVVVSIGIFNFIFAFGPSSLPYLITPELVTRKSRGAACTWAMITTNVMRSLLLIAYFPIKSLLGDSLSYGILFIPPCVLAVVVIYWKLPETKGKSSEQVQEELSSTQKSTN